MLAELLMRTEDLSFVYKLPSLPIPEQTVAVAVAVAVAVRRRCLPQIIRAEFSFYNL